MKIHSKLILLISMFTLVILALYIAFIYGRSREISIFLKTKHQSDQRIINKVLEFKAKGYSQATRDNAAWDGMYDFIKSRDTAWAAMTMHSTSSTFSLDYFSSFDTAGNCVYGVRNLHDPELKISPAMVKEWFQGKRMIHHFIKSSDNIWEVFGCVIVPTSDIELTSAQRGYLITAIEWDSAHLEQISIATGFHVAILDSVKHEDTLSTRKGSDIYHSLEDGDQHPIAILHFSVDNPFMQDIAFFKNLAIVLFIVCVFLSLIFLILTYRWIASPLRAINKSLDDGEIGPVEKYLEKGHDFGEIARMLKRYKEQTSGLIAEVNARTQAEEKYRAAFEANFSAMAIIEPDLKISAINESFTLLSGYTKEDVAGKTWLYFVPESDKEHMIQLNKQRVEEPGTTTSRYEFNYIHKDGSLRHGIIAVIYIPSTGQLVISMREKN